VERRAFPSSSLRDYDATSSVENGRPLRRQDWAEKKKLDRITGLFNHEEKKHSKK
jgi:hypothetical protein